MLPELLVHVNRFHTESSLSVVGSDDVCVHEVWQVLQLDVQTDYSFTQFGDLLQMSLKFLDPCLPIAKLAKILNRLRVVHYLVCQRASAIVHLHINIGQLDLETFDVAMDFDDGCVD